MKKKNSKSQKGAALVDYALLVSLIAITTIAGVGFFGNLITLSFNNASLMVNCPDGYTVLVDGSAEVVC